MPSCESLVRIERRGGREDGCRVEPVGHSKEHVVVESDQVSAGANSSAEECAGGPDQGKLEPDHPVLAWMCEYASVLLSRFEVS